MRSEIVCHREIGIYRVTFRCKYTSRSIDVAMIDENYLLESIPVTVGVGIRLKLNIEDQLLVSDNIIVVY